MLYARGPRHIGFIAPASSSLFPTGPAGPSAHRPPLTLASGFILSWAYAPLQSSPSQPAPALITRERLPWGSRCPLRGMNRRTSRSEFPGSPPSALGVSHALDGFLRIRSRGFVSPHCHVQGSSLQGFLPRVQPRSPRRWNVPSRRWRASAAAGCPTAPLPPASPTGPCSVRESVVAEPGFSRPVDPIPSWDSFLLQVLRHRAVRTG